MTPCTKGKKRENKMIKIYGYRLSPFVERIYQLVTAKGIEDKFEFCAIPDDDLRSATYLALNPLAKMPVMEDGDLCMPESTIICEYIDAKFPQNPMLPDSLEEITAVKMINRMLDLYIFLNMFEASAIAGGDKPDKDLIAKKMAQLNAGLDIVERFIDKENGQFLVGDKWSMADCSMVSADFFFSRILERMGVDAYANRPKLKAWHDVQIDTPKLKETYKTMDKELVAFIKKMKEK